MGEVKSFVARYLERVAMTRSVLCVGLDPTYDHVPPGFPAGLEGFDQYMQLVITAAFNKVPVVKFQYACYASLGAEGIEVLTGLVAYAHRLGLLVILDAKRADIGSTMEGYGHEVFGQIGADACTFVPYLGPTFLTTPSSVSWEPWLRRGHSVISMIRTSNPEAALLQDLELRTGERVYEYVARMVGEWDSRVRSETGGLGGVGGVVGATWPEQASRCRKLAGDDVFFLIPGYGAQGGGAGDAVSALPGSTGRLMGTVNSSRGITRDSWRGKSGQPKDNRGSVNRVTEAIVRANQELNTALQEKLGHDPYS